jgi:imidazolonepropionase
VQTALPEPAPDKWTLIRNARQLLTLHGPAGLRRGPASGELNIIPNGAVLIRNQVIEEVGPTRRLENLAAARGATEIDAARRVVMPAFIDADFPLVVPPAVAGDGAASDADGSALRKMARERMHARAMAAAAECARYGCLTIGAHTAWATDLTNIRRVLLTHQMLYWKPLRIRSIFSTRLLAVNGQPALQTLETLVSKWLPAVRKGNLAVVVEFALAGDEQADELALIRDAATAAAGLGFAIRMRSVRRPDPAMLQLAVSAGAIAIVAPNDGLRAFVGPLATLGCVRVLPASESFDRGGDEASCVRMAISEGAAIAIASSYRPRGSASFNMQFLLHLAVRRFGLTPAEAIMAATYTPACALRMSHVTGSLEPGKQADLILMDVPDYRELPRRAGHHDVHLVMRAGRVVYRTSALNLD